MSYLIAPDYGQQFLLPPSLEDWVPADHPARFLREFVDQLDLPKLGFVVSAAEKGRPAYAPSLLLKVWLHGYFHRIRSTRKLEIACREHLSLIWLTGSIAPDHNSLWRFWRDNKKALRTIFKQTVQVAMRSGCVGFALQALDGTKIQAAASRHTGWSKEYMEKLQSALEAAANEMDQKIQEENTTSSRDGYRLPEDLTEREALQEKIKAGLKQLSEDGREYFHPVEPEARRMKVGQTNRYAYNAQAVADQKEGIIVACENTREENDHGQLAPMIEQARQNLGVTDQQITTLADTGYSGGPDLQAAKDKGFDVLTPPKEGNKENPYSVQHFQYDPQAQSVTCPQGVQLHHQGHTTKRGFRVDRYRCRCRDCPVISQCTKDKKGRLIEIWPYTPLVQEMRKRVEEQKEKWRKRGSIIELRFGHIKQHAGFRRWTVWGLEGVKTQWSLICAASNLRALYRNWLKNLKTA